MYDPTYNHQTSLILKVQSALKVHKLYTQTSHFTPSWDHRLCKSEILFTWLFSTVCRVNLAFKCPMVNFMKRCTIPFFYLPAPGIKSDECKTFLKTASWSGFQNLPEETFLTVFHLTKKGRIPVTYSTHGIALCQVNLLQGKHFLYCA